MRKTCVPILLGICLLGPGCSFVRNIRRNIAYEIRYVQDERTIDKRVHRLARQAWEAMVHEYGECFSEAYEDGFCDGFVDYLKYGGCTSGSGESPSVPAVPTEKYTHVRYMSPQGYHAVEEWFMGFRHGSATAQASGLRNLVVVPVFNPPNYPSNETPQQGSAKTGNDTLPAPRPMEDGTPAGPPSPMPGAPNPMPGAAPGAGGAPAAATNPPGVPGVPKPR